MTTSRYNNHCRKCKAPSGAFHYCAAHRRQNAAKARARRQSSRRARRASHVLDIPKAAPTASEAWYRDQEQRRNTAALVPVSTGD